MRRILQILGVLVLLAAVGVVGLILFLPTEQIVRLASEQIKAQTGRELSVTGDISPSIYPVLGIEVDGIALSNAEWAEAPEMISAGSAKVGVRLIALMSGDIEVTEIHLSEPRIALEIGDDGVGNWGFAESETTSTSGDAGGSGDLGHISFGEILIESGAVQFIDRPNGATYELDEINADITLATLDSPLSVAGDAVWNGEKATLELEMGALKTALEGGETEIDLKLASAPVALSFDGSVIPPTGGGALEASGVFSVTSADPAAAMTWALGAADPALEGITDLSVEGQVAIDATALSIDVKGGATRDRRRATVAVKALGLEGWEASRAFTLDASVDVAGAASATFKGDIAAPYGALPTVKGAYSVASQSPADAMIWATGAAPEALVGLSDVSLAGDVDFAEAFTLTGIGGAVRDGRRASLDLNVAGTAGWMDTMAFDVALDADIEGVAAVKYDGAIAAPAGGLPTVVGAYELASQNPAAAMTWATGTAPAELAGITDLSFAGEIDMADALRATGAGGAVRDGRRASVNVTATGAPGWMTARAFDIALSADVDGLASLSYSGAVAAPEGSAPSVDGTYKVRASSVGAAIAWATGQAADPELSKIRDLASDGRVRLGAGLSATAKGGLAHDGRGTTFDVAVDGAPGWETSRAFAVTAAIAGGKLGSANFIGDVRAPVGGTPGANGAFAIDLKDLRAVAALVGAALPADNPRAFRTLAAKGTISTPAANSVAVRLDSLVFDAIRASGDVAATLSVAPTVNATLTTGPLNLNPYITGGESTPAGKGWSEERIDLTALGALNGDIQLRAQSVKAQNIELGVSDVTAKLRGGRLDLKIRELGLYGGGVKGDIAVNGAQNNALTANVSASAIRLLPMLKSLADLSLIEGLGQMQINVTGGGRSMNAIMNSLNGSGSVKLTNGAIVGYNLAAMVRNAQNAFLGNNKSARTDFSEVSGTFDITQGLLTNADFRFLGPLIRITGAGDVDLGGQRMKFRLVPKAVATLEGQGGASDVAGLSFPLLVTGPWSNLSIRPDLEAGIGEVLKDPEGALNAAKGIVDGVQGGGLEGAAGAALGAVTGGGTSGTEDIIDNVTKGGADDLVRTLSKGSTGSSSNDPIAGALGAITGGAAAAGAAAALGGGGDTQKAAVNPNREQIKKINERIVKLRDELEDAKAKGDRETIKKKRARIKKLRERRDQLAGR